MKKPFVLIAILAIAFGTLKAQDCDCTIFPFKPEACVDVCFANILKNASENELMLFLGLDAGLTKKIKSIGNQGEVSSLKDYQPVLDKGEFENVQKKLSEMNSLQNSYFQINDKDKSKFLKQLDKLDIESEIKE